jgi:hypothetical protein
MAVGLLGRSVALLTVVVSRRRVLLGLLVLPVGVMVGRLQVMVRGGVMVCGGLSVMLDRRVLGLLCHGLVLQWFGNNGRFAPKDGPRSVRR